MSDSEQALFNDMNKRIKELERNLRYASGQLENVAHSLPGHLGTLLESEARKLREIADWKMEIDAEADQ